MIAMIVVENLHRSFAGQQVLQGVNLKVEKGEILALIGRSGYGKSVLLRHIMGLARPDRGRVLIEDLDIHRISRSQRNSLKLKFGVLFQGGALFDSLTVFDNLAFPLREHTDFTEHEIGNRVREELDQLDLQGSEKKYPAEISGGMRKRVALGRAIIQNPQIVFFDEPTTGLDPVTTRTIHELIAKTHRRLKFTAIVVTHEIPEIFSIIDRVALLHDGRIAASGTPAEMEASDHPVLKSFFPPSGHQDAPMEAKE